MYNVHVDFSVYKQPIFFFKFYHNYFRAKVHIVKKEYSIYANTNTFYVNKKTILQVMR